MAFQFTKERTDGSWAYIILSLDIIKLPKYFVPLSRLALLGSPRLTFDLFITHVEKKIRAKFVII